MLLSSNENESVLFVVKLNAFTCVCQDFVRNFDSGLYRNPCRNGSASVFSIVK